MDTDVFAAKEQKTHMDSLTNDIDTEGNDMVSSANDMVSLANDMDTEGNDMDFLDNGMDSLGNDKESEGNDEDSCIKIANLEGENAGKSTEQAGNRGFSQKMGGNCQFRPFHPITTDLWNGKRRPHFYAQQ
jgi:hypothetical protein